MKHVTHGPCPKCGSRDNLATYKDGHQWCFGCKYYVPAVDDLKSRVERRNEERNQYGTVAGCPALPKDADADLGIQGIRWLKKYGITDEEIRDNAILWSDSRQQLVFPIYGSNGEGIVFWQARNFDPEQSKKRKYFTSGSVDATLHVLRSQPQYSVITGEEIPVGEAPKGSAGSKNRLFVILTEDLLSSIKVARQVQAMPIFGSNISDSRLNRLRDDFNHVVMWLDYDKRKEARIAYNQVRRLGMKFDAIITELDPKELSDKEISEHLESLK